MNSAAVGNAKSKLLTSWDVLAGLFPFLACLPFLIGQAILMWRDPQTMVGLAVWLFVAVVVALRGRGMVSTHKARMGLATTLTLFASYLLVTGVLYWSPGRVTLQLAVFWRGWGCVRFDKCRWHEPVAWGCFY